MIPIIEDYLHLQLVNRLAYLKTNPDQINRILSIASQTRLNRLKSIIQSTPIKVIKGFPRTPAELPCLCIILSGEEETQETLGDYGEDEDTDIVSHTETLTVSSDNTLKLSNFPLVDVTSITNITTDNDLEYEYHVTNQDRGFLKLSEESKVGDQISLGYSFRNSSLDLIQTMYESNYRIEAWTTNGDLTVDLYHIAKWAILSSRSYLVNELGLFRQKLGGADFEPATSYFPEFVYRRALTFWCQFSSSVPDEVVPYIRSVDANGTIDFDID